MFRFLQLQLTDPDPIPLLQFAYTVPNMPQSLLQGLNRTSADSLRNRTLFLKHNEFRIYMFMLEIQLLLEKEGFIINDCKYLPKTKNLTHLLV